MSIRIPRWTLPAGVLLVGTAIVSCAGGGGVGRPQILGGNETYVVLKDRWGFGEAPKVAAEHCSKFGRTAQFQSRGGDAPGCSGRESNLCYTYRCVR